MIIRNRPISKANYINRERWNVAQSVEIVHTNSPGGLNPENTKHALEVFMKYFEVNLESFRGKTILEIGGSNYPISAHAIGFKKAINIEPLYEQFSEESKLWIKEKGVQVIPLPFEDFETNELFDEVWFFNVLQHVMANPRELLQKAKRLGKIIRVFEPINTGTNISHPWEITQQMLKEVFPNEDIKIYRGGSAVGFHGHDCAYFSALTGLK